MTEPNPRQQALIDSTDGLHLVDAGAGTGKTFTVTRRYANIVESSDVKPEDILLVTFTDNAATEMKDRIVAHSDYGIRELTDAPIQTFHSRCHDVLMEHGFDAPVYLGIDDRITGSTRVIDDETIEKTLFREFIRQFADDHPKYDDFFRVLRDRTELLGLINKLAAKGVFPTADGWYRNSERHLDGDFEAFRAMFEEINQARNDGRKQSRLRSKLGRYGRDKSYRSDAPPIAELRGQDTKQVPPAVARRVFEEDREALKDFVRDVYHGYLAFALGRNYLNYGFLQLFAFVLLCEDHAVREQLAYEYVMVDEFQDSSVIQFKLALLLAGTNNLCVVGDWKQSIYSFQYAAVENITDFEARLDRFVDELNDDYERVGFPTAPVERIELVENYRSTQAVLDFAEHGLEVPAANNDDVDVEAIREQVVSLHSNAEHENSRIEAIQHEDEPEAILTKIQEIVGDERYQVEEDGDLRAPEHRDIAVLSRTRSFGRELLQAAREHGIPMAYDGGIELFHTDQAKLLLAWLRILESDSERGWAVVLEEAGYTLDEIKHILNYETYPDNMVAFKDELGGLASVGGVARQVFSRYGYDGGYADVILTTIQSIHDTTTLTRGDLVRFIERGIEAGSTHEVHAGAGTNSVTVQTIHATKGLEHPIVILANMNSRNFPPHRGSAGTITYEDPVGLRQRKVYAEDHGHPHVYDNWRADVLRTCLPREYDEERRLLYVAMTRAEHHLIFTAGEEPNTFLDELPVEIQEYVPDVDVGGPGRTEQARLQISMPTPDGPVGHTPHTLMDDEVFEEVTEGRGREFGGRVHEFAERYARGEAVEPSDDGDDERHVKAFIDSLDGDLRIEEDAYLPLTVDGERVTVSGIVDLVHITDGGIEIVDFKTDLGRRAEPEYRKQLSVYYHVLSAWYPEREITASIYYTADDERVAIDPLSEGDLEQLVREQMAGQAGSD